ncbi:MAG TPA: peptidylprolyl isomerase [Methyloceanibacter sp.]|nr:peptidylprolyl isomerase [Methyloceanibacter sp.]
MNARAPESYKAKFETSKGAFVIQVTRSWAPNGADRFYNLVKNGFFDDARFFRVIDGFMVQFGISGNPDVSAAWTNATIPDDPVRESNARGTVTFATAGPNTRTTQVFINFNNNSMLNGQGFAPFGKVVSGMNVVDSFYKGYGEGAPRGNGPNQGLLKSQGNAYLLTQFPKLDYIKKATIQ